MRPLSTNSLLPSAHLLWPSLRLTDSTEKETEGQRVGSRPQLELAVLPGQAPRVPHPHLQWTLQLEWRGACTRFCRAGQTDLKATGS